MRVLELNMMMGVLEVSASLFAACGGGGESSHSEPEEVVDAGPNVDAGTDVAADTGRDDDTGRDVDSDHDGGDASSDSEDCEQTWYRDADGDGYGDPDRPKCDTLRPAGYVENSGDCDDSSERTYPGAGTKEDGSKCMRDADEDGYGDSSPPQGVASGSDCADDQPTVHPGQDDICDEVDNNCSGVIDEGCPCHYQGTSEGVCENGTIGDGGQCQSPPAFESPEESRDDRDNDCDGTVDDIVAVSAGGGHACNMMLDGTVECWGRNHMGQAEPPSSTTFEQISAGFAHTCGVTTGGTLECWGSNDAGESNPPAGTFKQVSAGQYQTCGITGSDSLECWGANDSGQSNSPSGTFEAVKTRNWHACGRKTAGSIQCWGSNDYGQTNPPSGTFDQVEVGAAFSCAVSTTGSIECWGRNSHEGELDAPSGSFRHISLGFAHGCGATNAGPIKCWGADDEGEATPPSGSFEDVSAGSMFTCAVTENETVECWGNNAFGQAEPPSP